MIKEQSKESVPTQKKLVPKKQVVTKKKPVDTNTPKAKQIRNVITNGHKKEKVRPLEDWEKDLIRKEFIRLNGEITHDSCLEIKKKLSKKTAIFQVTGFVTRLHEYVKKGTLELHSLEHYYYFQYLKKHGEIEYNQQIQSGKKTNTQVMTIIRK